MGLWVNISEIINWVEVFKWCEGRRERPSLSFGCFRDPQEFSAIGQNGGILMRNLQDHPIFLGIWQALLFWLIIKQNWLRLSVRSSCTLNDPEWKTTPRGFGIVLVFVNRCLTIKIKISKNLEWYYMDTSTLSELFQSFTHTHSFLQSAHRLGINLFSL